MRPEVFTIPGINLTIQSYGTMLVLAFIFGGLLATKNARKVGENPDNIANLIIYAMLGGVIGARVFHVIHFWEEYQDNLLGIIKIWQGGLEFVGGFITASLAMYIYAKKVKLPVRKYMDILAPALMIGLAFGRVGCLMNGCCYGKVCDHPWGITFPAVNDVTDMGIHGGKTIRYSYPYFNQLHRDFDRSYGPEIELPLDYYGGYVNQDEEFVYSKESLPEEEKGDYYIYPKPITDLSEQQVAELRAGKHPMKKIHPTQIYSSINALLICGILMFSFSRRKNEGMTFSYLLILYGITRFIIEGLRADSPLEFDRLTISQNLSIFSVLLGLTFMFIFTRYPRPYEDQEMETGDKNGQG